VICQKFWEDNILGYASRYKDLVGKRFGRIIVLSRNGRNKHRSAIWKCLCDCGNIFNAVGSRLIRGDTKSCGCIKKEMDINKMAFIHKNGLRKNREFLPNGGAAFTYLYCSYKHVAKIKNLEFNLSREDFQKIIKSNCYICGSEPKTTAKTISGSAYVYNGIDRVDNNKGYILTNCEPCCERCNKAKLAYSLDDFKNFLVKAYKNLICT
jgi:hypothetical protein